MSQKVEAKFSYGASSTRPPVCPPSFTLELNGPRAVSTERLTSLLVRAVHSHAEQEELFNLLRRLALTDELTGLYSRRGFLVLGGQQLKLARRMKVKVTLIYCDVVGLKKINDLFGHREGDSALQKVAKALRRTFRDSDVIARIGGDEFTILALDGSTFCKDEISDRLSANLRRLSLAEVRYDLTLSVGMTNEAVDRTTRLEQMMARADARLYAEKRMRAQSNLPSASASRVARS